SGRHVRSQGLRRFPWRSRCSRPRPCAHQTGEGVALAMSSGNQHGVNRTLLRALDPAFAIAIGVVSPALVAVCRARSGTPLSRSLLDMLKISLVRHHYYEPVVTEGDLALPLDHARPLPAVVLNEVGQLAIIANFHSRDELLAIPLKKTAV